MKKTIEIEISEMQCDILAILEGDPCCCKGYWELEDTGRDRKELQKDIAFLRTVGLVEYYRGLMNDDNEVTGSGFCRTKAGNEFVEKYNL